MGGGLLASLGRKAEKELEGDPRLWDSHCTPGETEASHGTASKDHTGGGRVQSGFHTLTSEPMPVFPRTTVKAFVKRIVGAGSWAKGFPRRYFFSSLFYRGHILVFMSPLLH